MKKQSKKTALRRVPMPRWSLFDQMFVEPQTHRDITEAEIRDLSRVWARINKSIGESAHEIFERRLPGRLKGKARLQYWRG
jgi:hypothetical protein